MFLLTYVRWQRLSRCLCGGAYARTDYLDAYVQGATEGTEASVRSAYSILPPMVVNVYVAYIVYRTLRVVVIPT